jgi:hypothetical protein
MHLEAGLAPAWHGRGHVGSGLLGSGLRGGGRSRPALVDKVVSTNAPVLFNSHANPTPASNSAPLPQLLILAPSGSSSWTLIGSK